MKRKVHLVINPASGRAKPGAHTLYQMFDRLLGMGWCSSYPNKLGVGALMIHGGKHN